MDARRLFRTELYELGKVVATARGSMASDVSRLVRAAAATIESGGKILLFGNGGSAAQASHIATELVVRYKRDRRPIPAIALNSDTAVLTAAGNDLTYERIFDRQVLALGARGDMAVGLSTSGRSVNVRLALDCAVGIGMRAALITGHDREVMSDVVDIRVCVPSTNIARVQELHLVIGHVFAAALEEWVSPDTGILTPRQAEILSLIRLYGPIDLENLSKLSGRSEAAVESAIASIRPKLRLSRIVGRQGALHGYVLEEVEVDQVPDGTSSD